MSTCLGVLSKLIFSAYHIFSCNPPPCSPASLCKGILKTPANLQLLLVIEKPQTILRAFYFWSCHYFNNFHISLNHFPYDPIAIITILSKHMNIKNFCRILEIVDRVYKIYNSLDILNRCLCNVLNHTTHTHKSCVYSSVVQCLPSMLKVMSSKPRH